MGDHFKTDIDQLDQFVKSLENSVKDLDEARKALSDVRGDQIGTPRLDEACDGFQDHWKYGSEQMREMIGGIQEGVKSLGADTAKQMEQQGTSAGGGK